MRRPALLAAANANMSYAQLLLHAGEMLEDLTISPGRSEDRAAGGTDDTRLFLMRGASLPGRLGRLYHVRTYGFPIGPRIPQCIRMIVGQPAESSLVRDAPRRKSEPRAGQFRVPLALGRPARGPHLRSLRLHELQASSGVIRMRASHS